MKKVMEKNWVGKDVSLYKNCWEHLVFVKVSKVCIND
jgi:hypothetical protein